MTGRPVWDIEAYIHAKSDQEVPTECAEGKVRFVLYDDGQWSAVVRREPQAFDLILRGTENSRTTATMGEVFTWLFGRAA